MLKESETGRYAQRRTHRTYTAQFKAQLVQASQQPGASIAALALQHGMNANVLHRWISEHQRLGRHTLGLSSTSAIAAPATAPAFVALPLPMNPPVQHEDIRIDLRKGTTTMAITWPAAAAGDCALWMRELLR
jgi:transposase-like protein